MINLILKLCDIFFDEDGKNLCEEKYISEITHYLSSIKCDNISFVRYVGFFFEKIRDTGNLIKYYQTYIEKKDVIFINDLGNYYFEMGDYDNMKKYDLMGVEQGDPGCMNNLGF